MEDKKFNGIEALTGSQEAAHSADASLEQPLPQTERPLGRAEDVSLEAGAPAQEDEAYEQMVMPEWEAMLRREEAAARKGAGQGEEDHADGAAREDVPLSSSLVSRLTSQYGQPQGVIHSVRNLDTLFPSCVLNWGPYRVVIPGREMFLEQWPEKEPAPAAIRTRLSRILGARVDFVPQQLEEDSGVLYGSRRESLRQTIRNTYGQGRISVGDLLDCQVVGVGNNRVRVEASGLESVIETGQLAWEWFSDVREVFHTGQMLRCKVTDLQHQEDGAWRVTLSRKLAVSPKDGPVLRTLQKGSVYFGTVTGVRSGIYFVRLQAGANAKTKLCRDARPAQQGDTVAFLVRDVLPEKFLTYGLITQVIQRKHASLQDAG